MVIFNSYFDITRGYHPGSALEPLPPRIHDDRGLDGPSFAAPTSGVASPGATHATPGAVASRFGKKMFNVILND